MTVADEILRLLHLKASFLVGRSTLELEAILDPGFVYIDVAGRRFDRDGYLAAFCGPQGTRFLSQSFDDLQIRDHGPFVVATMNVHDTLDFEGRIESSIFRSLCVFGSNDSGWLWSAGQTSAAAR